MINHKKQTSYIRIPAKSQSFFELSEQFGDIASFRRILSILRLKDECETIIRLDTIVDVEGNGLCREKENDRRCDSCTAYLKYMKGQKGNLQLTKKSCSKLFFFSCEIGENEDITASKHQKDFIGYCLIHSDELKDLSGSHPNKYIRSYVPECVLKRLNKSIRGYKYGNITSEVTIGEEQFSVQAGNYFSQQNGMTNCCAHAAIKTTLRGYDQSVSCDSINKVLIDSKKQAGIDVDERIEITRMATKGLTPDEMLTAIKGISENNVNIPPLNPLLFKAHDMPMTSFVEIIYRAIESKLPVILLFRIPDKSTIANYHGGHAVSLVGHTFNKHNWCAYGSGYFSSQTRPSYLSSYLWCDNYVVQDDNFGPAYHLPCSFLADYFDYGVTNEKLGLNIASQRPLDSNKPEYPLAAIVIPPVKMNRLTKRLDGVEHLAAQYFVDQLNKFSREKVFNFSKKQKKLFDRYFYYIFKLKLTKPRVFITRTLLVSRKEYLESSVNKIYSNHNLGDTLLIQAIEDDILPEYFWLTEISVPELYWVNNHKIGEIILNTEESSDDGKEIRLIRLPYFLALYPGDDEVAERDYYPIELNNQALDETHVEILRKRQGLIRQVEV